MSGIRISPAKINTDIEKKIITNLIVDTQFCQSIIPITKPEYFEIPYVKRIFSWTKEYFDKFGSAPEKYIQDIYRTKSEKISPEDKELIGDFLESLSSKYLEADEKRNTKFYVDEAIQYIKKQSYIKLAESISSYAKLGQIEEVENQLFNHHKVGSATSRSVNLNDPEVAKQILKTFDSNKLFTLPGALGELIGPFESSRVYGVLARSGVGKTFFLSELALCAAIEKYKVLMASWEMSKEQVGSRWYKRLSAMGDVPRFWIYPVIDCRANQIGSCSKKERKSKVSLMNQMGDIPEYGKHDKNYQACDVCRGDKDFEVATWHDSIYREELTEKKLEGILSGFNLIYGDNVRSCSFPKFDATVADVEHEIRMLEYKEGFCPSVLTLDYDSLILPERFYSEQRNNSDEIYKSVGRLSHKYGLCIFLASQVNREGSKKKKAKATDIGEDWRKFQHLDGLIMLNQSDLEKEVGVVRVSVGKLRDGEFVESREVAVLQNLSLSQSLLDSEFIKTKSGYDD